MTDPAKPFRFSLFVALCATPWLGCSEGKDLEAGAAGSTSTGGATTENSNGEGGAGRGTCPRETNILEGQTCAPDDLECHIAGSDASEPLIAAICRGGVWEFRRGLADPNACPSDLYAANGMTCWYDGKICVTGQTSDCSDVSLLTCTSGSWVWRETAPDPDCGLGGAGGGTGD